MAGIRVHISESLLDKYETSDLRIKLEVYFEDRGHGGGDIKEMHFPVLQYEAVIIFEESSVVDGVMRLEHIIDGKKLCIRRLPLCQIYRQLHTDLDPDMASIIQGCEIIDTLEREIKLTMQYDKKMRTLIGFVGSWYQLETAWTLIDNLMVQQNRILLQRYNSNIDEKGRPSRSAGLPSSDEDENLSLLIRPLEHEPRRIKQREEHDHSEDDHTALASKAVGSEHVAEKSSASPSARQRKHERTSLSDLAIDVDKAAWKEFPHDELSSQQNHSRTKKIKMIDENEAPQSVLQDTLVLMSDHLKASSTGKEEISKSFIHQGGTDAVSAQLQHNVESDTHPNLPRQEELNGKQERGLVVGKDVGYKRYRMPIKQCLIDNTDDSDGTPSLDLHGQGFASPDQSLSSGVESNGRQRDITQNETYYCASINDESSVKREGVQYGDGITNSKPLQDIDDSTEQYEDSVIGMLFQYEGSGITFSPDLKKPQLEFIIVDIRVVVMRGDITKEKSEGIVSAASSLLDSCFGIAKAIATAAGNQLQRECKDFIQKHKFLDTTKVIHTSAGGRLNDKVTCVLHAVGPIWNEKFSSDETFRYELTTTYVNCLQCAEKKGLHSLSLPLISSGIGGGSIDLCVRSFIDGLLIFINRLEKGPRLQEIHLINTDLEGTQLTIVMLQQLLEMGLKNLIREALTNFDKKYAKKTTTTRSRRSSSLTRFNRRESVLSTKDNYKEAETVPTTRGRTSSVRRKTSTSELKETQSGQVTSSTSTQTSKKGKTEPVQKSSVAKAAGDKGNRMDLNETDSKINSSGRRKLGSSLLLPEQSNVMENGTSSTTHRPASATGVTSGISERDQDGNGSSCPTRTGRDGQSASAGRPVSAVPRLNSQKSSRSSESQTESLDGGSVGHTKSPPQIKPSLLSQEPTPASKKKERKKEIAAKAKSQPLKAVHDSQDSDSNMGSPRSPRGDSSDDSLGSSRDAAGEKMFARRDLKLSEHILDSTQSLPSDLEKPPHKTNPRMAATLPLGLSQRHVEERDMDTVCSICLEMMHKPKTLPKCKHKFCSECIEKYFKKCKPVCPQCGYVYGVIKGDQPKGGKMTYKVDKVLRLPGYEDAEGAIIITYDIPGGKQEDHHPRPGEMYSGLYRTAYLPNCSDGKLVLKLLQRAFHAGLIFTVGESKTTGRDNMITWNDIHHKTSIHGGSTNFGYPDPTYLQRVQEELAAKGITKDTV